MESSTTQLSKKKKQHPAAGEEGGKDFINELPEPILLHILSFLDMKYVMETRLVSKNWRYLWMILTFLNFSQSVYDVYRAKIEEGMDESGVPRFRNWGGLTDFIDRVLFLRNQSSNIQNFSLFCQDFKGHKMLGSIYTWVRVLVQKSVEVMDLNVWSNYRNLELPECLFTCKTLTTLKLNMGPSTPVFHLPTDSSWHHLPALKYLNLTHVRIVDGIEYLISNAPILETLIFFNCRSCVENQLSISAPELKYLIIDSMYDIDDRLDYSCFKVFAPKLILFGCKDFPINEYSFMDNNTSLVNAIVEADTRANYFFETDPEIVVSEFRASRKVTYIQNAIKCLTGICHVRNLTLSAWLLEIVTGGLADLGSWPLDNFCHLKVLKLKTTLSKYEILGIMYFLMKCPLIETLMIEVVGSKSNSEARDACSGMLQNFVGSKSNSEEKVACWGVQAPECVMRNLKLIKIQGVLTSADEFELLKFLLKNSIILEKIIVSTSDAEQQQPIKDIDLELFLDWLEIFPGTPSKIEIVFLPEAKPWITDSSILGRFKV